MFSPDGTLISASAVPHCRGNILGRKETFKRRYIGERTNKAEIRPEEQSEKAESHRGNLWNEIQLKGHEDSNRHKDKTKRSGRARLVYVKNINSNFPTT